MASSFSAVEPGLDRLEDLERAAVSLYVAQGREVKSLRGAPAATVLAKTSPKEHDDEIDASMPLPYEYIYEAELEAKGWARLRLKTGAPRNQSQVSTPLVTLAQLRTR